MMYDLDRIKIVHASLEEDIKLKDITAELIPTDKQIQAYIITREAAKICGIPYVEEVLRQLGNQVHIEWFIEEGALVVAQQKLCVLKGNARILLSAERAILNFLQTLSATATLTYRFLEQVKGLPVQILDTRKTIPGLRAAQKYAVRCAGGMNHRMGLYDAFLIKENHIFACGSIKNAVQSAKSLNNQYFIEVEVENLEQLREALTCPIDRILLDNFDVEQVKQAVAITQKKIPLEISGNINLENIRLFAQTGIDYISIGFLTKNIKAIDLSMRFFNEESK